MGIEGKKYHPLIPVGKRIRERLATLLQRRHILQWKARNRKVGGGQMIEGAEAMDSLENVEA